MRKSIDGLSVIVQDRFQLDPFSEHLFVFCNQNKNRIKVLHWDHHAFWLYYQRLEKGTYKWPINSSEVSQINIKEFRALLDGLMLMQFQKSHEPIRGKVV